MALFTRANVNTILANNCLFKLTCNDNILQRIVKKSCKFMCIKKSSIWIDPTHLSIHADITSNVHTNFIRKSHTVSDEKNCPPFEQFLLQRREEASRTILVQVQSQKSGKDLHSYCEEFGKVNNMHFYTLDNKFNFFLIEFDNESGAQCAIQSTTHLNYEHIVPVQSPMVWFRQNKISKALVHESTKNYNDVVTINKIQMLQLDDVLHKLNKINLVSNQITTLYESCKLSETCMRLRFLTAYQLERSFFGLFPHVTVFPFGSSVNGFGKRGCDLDLTFRLQNSENEKTSSRFVFQTKSISNTDKMEKKKFMEALADVMDNFVPGITNVRRILHARVPIIKFTQTLTGLECDLSVTTQLGLFMSELLFLYGEIDNRVRPLVFTIRQWASSMALTHYVPGRWITNFSLTLLIIFYLQQKGILPSLNVLKRHAGKDDIRVANEIIDCTFLRDVRKLPVDTKLQNNEDLYSLLKGFFEYYSQFDFSTQAISLRDGKAIIKPAYAPLYIFNPLEVHLNVSKNVGVEEVERMKIYLRNTLWIIDRSESFHLSMIFNKNQKIPTHSSRSPAKHQVNYEALFKIPKEDDTDAKVRRTTLEIKNQVKRSRS